MWNTFENLLQQYGTIAVVAALVGAIAGAVLTKFIPFLWTLAGKLMSWLAKILGGKFAFHDFEKRYLDWVVTELKELKLTGVVSYDDAKKPQLEQVFVSLRVGKQKELASDLSDLFADGSFDAFFSAIFGQSQPEIRQASPATATKRNLILHQSDLHVIPGNHDIERNPRGIALLRSMYYFVRTLAREFLSGLSASKTSLLLHRAVQQHSAVDTEVAQLRRILNRHERIAVLGIPGAGKTTLLQYIALAYARERAGDPKLRRHRILKERLGMDKWRLPLFVPLGRAATLLTEVTASERDPSIVDILPRLLPPDFQRDYGNVASGYFAHHLKRGNCVMLLDGLDEVPTDAEFHTVVRAIESLAVRYEKNQFILTSRIAGWRSGVGAEFELFYVQDLSDAQVETFIDSWYSAVEKNAVVGRLEDESESERRARERRALQRANDLKRALRENAGIRRLATNPMLLSIIALVHRSLATLPKERSKLYIQCSKILLEQWDISRSVHVDDTNLKLEQKEAIMRRLAYALHSGEIGAEGGGRDASRAEVQRLISDMLPGFGRSKEEAEHLLQRLIERSGIITERERDILAFAHQTFQEHFAAQYLAVGERESYRDFLLDRKRLLSDWWREVLLLYAGLLSDSSEVLELIHKQAPDDLCQQRLRLAAFCLSESVEVKRTDVRRTIALDLLRVRTKGEIAEVKQPLLPEVVDYLLRWARRSEWYSYAAKASVLEAKDNTQVASVHDKLLVALDDQQSAIRQAALKATLLLPEHVRSQVLNDKLLSLLADKDSTIRALASEALRGVAETYISDDLVLGLINVLQDGNNSVRTASINTLTALSDKVRECKAIQDKFNSLSDDKDEKGRLAAAIIFPIFAAEASVEHINRFVKLLTTDSDNDVRREAKLVLTRLLSDTAPDDVVRKVMSLLKSESASVRATAIEVLGYLNAAAASRYDLDDELVSLLSDEDSSVGASAINAISQLSARGLYHEMAAKIAKLIDNPSSNVRTRAIRAIEKLGATAMTESMTEKLLDALYATESEVRCAAASALGLVRLPADQDRAVRKLMALMRDSDRGVRAEAIRSLGVLGQTALTDQVIDIVARALEDRDRHIKIAAVIAIAHLGRYAARKEVVDRLIRSSNDKGVLQWLRQTASRQPFERDIATGLFERDSDGRIIFAEKGIVGVSGGGLASSLRSVSRRRVLPATDEFQVAVLDALAELGTVIETNRIMSEFIKIVESHRNDTVVQFSALNAFAHLASKMASEETFDKLFRILELQQPFAASIPGQAVNNLFARTSVKLKYPWAVEKWLDSVRLHDLQYADWALNLPYELIEQPERYVLYPPTLKWTDSQVRPVMPYLLFGEVGPDHPLVVLAKQLPLEFVVSKLEAALINEHAHMRIMALRMIAALDGKLNKDLIKKWILAASEDREKNVRLAAITTAQVVAQATSTRDVKAAMIKRLGDDEEVVREKAWEVVEQCNEALGIWTQ